MEKELTPFKEESYFGELTPELKEEIAFYLSPDDIIKLCLTNTRFNHEICDDESFWKLLYHMYYNRPLDTEDWKKAFLRMSPWGTGNNYYGEYGYKEEGIFLSPHRIPLRAKFVSCGENHSFFIDIYDNAWGTGSNSLGQLGMGADDDIIIPTRLGLKVKQVACGAKHTLFIDLEDNVLVTGSNFNRQLGITYSEGTDTPIILSYKAKFVAAGTFHSVIIDTEGNVLTFGKNIYGQLGTGDKIDRDKPTNIGLKGIFAACGDGYTLIIDEENNVLTFGDNYYGQLGTGDKIDRDKPTNIGLKGIFASCGRDHTLVIDKNYNVWGLGDNLYGQLGTEEGVSEIEEFEEEEIEIKYIPSPLNIGRKAILVSCSDYFSYLIDLENNIYSFGLNDTGQLGLGDTEERNIPTQLPYKAIDVSCGSTFAIFIGYS